MANIIEKAFDVSKNIVRTIFLGKPNLFTTSDLNRQIQALKYQMDSIESRLGAESDMEIDFSSTGTQTRCTITRGAYFRVNGLSIPLPNPSDVFSVDAAYGTECYFYVWGNFTRKTYANDPTHEIAGAKFSDGTSMPAADQLVLSEVHYAMTDSIQDITDSRDDFVFLIAKMNVLNLYDKYIRLNYKKTGASVMMDSVNTLEYDTPWQQNAQGDISFNYRIKGGMLHIIGYPHTIIGISYSGGDSYLGATGTFEVADAEALLTYFNRLGYATQGMNLQLAIKYLFIPLGSCSITGIRRQDGVEGVVHGHGELGLMLSKSEGVFNDIFIGAYMTDSVCFDDDGTVAETLIGPISLLDFKAAQFTVNAFSAIIPLIE